MSDAATGELARLLAGALGQKVEVHSVHPVSGGCIHAAFRVVSTAGTFFAKAAPAGDARGLAAEATNLEALHATGVIRVPRCVARGSWRKGEVLLLEWIDFGPPPPDGWTRLGEALAALHEVEGPRFGWPENNVIGSTPQANAWSDDWVDFFREQRLGALFRRLAAQGMTFSRAPALLEALPSLLSGARARPSLLHGDLWSGNAGFAKDGSPVIFDPACYYGHAETDLAMTRLFGGFPPAFYAAYQARHPCLPGADQREALYQLYHVLNHALLFGGGYRGQAESIIAALVGRG